MYENLKPIFPDGLKPKGDEEAAEWVLRSLKDIDKYAGRCRIAMDVSQGTLITLSFMIDKEISNLGTDETKNIYEEWFKRQTLEDLKELRGKVDEADREAIDRYASSGRPKPYGMQLGDPTEMRFTREWMELIMKEELASVKSPRGKRA